MKAKKKPAKPVEKDEKQEIKVIERIIESKEVAPQDAFDKMTKSQVDLIKRTIAKGATDDELKMFLQVCKGAQLNPFMKQVFLVKRHDYQKGIEVATIQVGIDGFRSIAESSGNYAGNDDPVFSDEISIVKDTKQTKITVPGRATVTVYKVVEGQRYPFTATARWSEYYPGMKMGFQWHIRPYLMLGKCAEALALRKAFPKLLSGMYEGAELENTAQEKPTVVQAEPDKIFKTLSAVIQKASATELAEFKERINAPGKKAYTDEQKTALLGMIDARLASFNDDEIPVIDVKTGKPVVNQQENL